MISKHHTLRIRPLLIFALTCGLMPCVGFAESPKPRAIITTDSNISENDPDDR